MNRPTPGNADRRIGKSPISAEDEIGKTTVNADDRIGKTIQTHLGWYSRGYLPHADFPETIQSITYRLADSLPKHVIEQLNQELSDRPDDIADQERRRRIEKLLDAGMGSCVLRHEWAANLVVDNWMHFHGDRYDLIAWVVMPNHVHLLLRMHEGYRLGDLIKSWKRYTGRRILDRMADSMEGGDSAIDGPRKLWYRDYWDRYIRDEAHFGNAVNYIHQNPVKAGLARSPCEWPFSSAKIWMEQECRNNSPIQRSALPGEND